MLASLLLPGEDVPPPGGRSHLCHRPSLGSGWYEPQGLHGETAWQNFTKKPFSHLSTMPDLTPDSKITNSYGVPAVCQAQTVLGIS